MVSATIPHPSPTFVLGHNLPRIMQTLDRPAFCQPCQKPTQHQIRISIRPRLHRQNLNVRKLRTTKTRTTGTRDVLPRLLTKIEDMWLLDIREPQNRAAAKPNGDRRTRTVTAKKESHPRDQPSDQLGRTEV